MGKDIPEFLLVMVNFSKWTGHYLPKWSLSPYQNPARMLMAERKHYRGVMLYKLMIVAMGLVLLGSNVQSASPTVSNNTVFQIFGDGPVLDHGEPGSWNAAYTDPGAVMRYKDQFYMFYNGFNGWVAPVQIAYATSPDGLKWTKHGTDPILTSSQVPYARIAALASSVLVEDDGTWVLYFYTWESISSSLTSAVGRIGRATAPAPDGPWTVDPEAVLNPGAPGQWDDLRVDAPSVIKTDTGYVMYYAGTQTNGLEQIGMAISADGITWKKSDTPVFGPGAADTWDATRVHQPRVVKTDSQWVMLYRTVVAGHPSTIALGIATSTDGIQWTRFNGNPIFKAATDFGKTGFWYTALANKDNTYYAYV